MQNEASTEKEPSSNMLYVSNLPFTFDDETLSEVFSAFDVTSAYVATRRNGRSKGFGFVKFASPEAQQDALRAVDGNEHEGRTLTVKIAHKDERRDDRGMLKDEYRTQDSRPARQQNRTREPRQQQTRNRDVEKEPSPTVLYVSNLPFEFEDEDLANVFAEHNPVSARIARRRNDRSKGFGFVEFDNTENQQAALALDGHAVEDRSLSVKVSMVPVAGAETASRPAKSQQPSDTTLYVSNLPFDLSDDDLGEVFSSRGFEVVSARVARRRNDRSKGFGFVELASAEVQQEALAAVDGAEVQDRVLAVKVALRDSETKAERAPAPRARRTKTESATMVYVSNLSFQVEDEQLAQLFEGLTIKSAHVATRRNGRSKGFGFVDFETADDQQKALEKSGEEFEGRALTVEVAMETVEEEEVDEGETAE